jgi:CDP-glycerol glycerophosphotransferase
MSNANENRAAESDTDRITALERKLDAALQRIGMLEQTSTLVASAEQAAISALQDVRQKVLAQEHAALTGRIFKSLAAASKIFPKNRTVIFAGRDYIGDNIKYAFLAFCERAQAKDIACYFLTEDERQYRQWTAAGFPCLPASLHEWTAGHMRIMLEAKAAVACGIFTPSNEIRHFHWALLRGAKFIQLWHGIPLKEIGMECLYTPATFSERAAEMLAASGPFDVFMGTAARLRSDWEKRFSFREYAPTGYPRTDVFFRALTDGDRINLDEKAYRLAETAAHEGKPVILYVPTFRDQKLGVWFYDAGIERFAEACKSRGYVFLVNLHPFEGEYLADMQIRYSGIDFVAAQTDIYPILKHASILITDYSSLAFDFLLLDRPVVFYRPDHADYTAHSRPLVEGHEQYLCGEVTEAIDGLIAASERAVTAFRTPSDDPHRAARQDLTKKLYDRCDGDAGKRLAEVIMRVVGTGD